MHARIFYGSHGIIRVFVVVCVVLLLVIWLLVGPNVFHAVLVKGDSKCL